MISRYSQLCWGRCYDVVDKYTDDVYATFYAPLGLKAALWFVTQLKSRPYCNPKIITRHLRCAEMTCERCRWHSPIPSYQPIHEPRKVIKK